MSKRDYIDKSSPERLKIAIVTPPLPGHNKALETVLLNFLEIFKPLSEKIFLVTGNLPEATLGDEKLHIRNIKCDSPNKSMPIKIANYIMAQVKISFNLFRIPKKEVDVVIFLVGNALLLPMLTTKLLREKTIVVSVGSVSSSAGKVFEPLGRRGIILSAILTLLEKFTYALSNRLVVYSEGMVPFSGMEKYKGKLFTEGAPFVDTSLFRVNKAFGERKELVGYIGRFSEEKGIINFIRAIPLVSEKHPDIEFLIGGGGEISHKVEQELKRSQALDKVTFTEWIPHETLPRYLNELKLFVLPSFTEGLPLTILEAMACGTAVLATPVGGIPDVIKDGETGFILKDNSPQDIAESIINALEWPNLGEIIKKAQSLILRKYTYQAAVERYRKILFGGEL